VPWCRAFSVSTECMVRVRVRFGVATKGAVPSLFGRSAWLELGLELGLGLQLKVPYLHSVWTEFTASTGKMSAHPRGMA
jgi:hypothetical protein